MNQRLKRKSRNNRVADSTLATGSYIVHASREEPHEVRVPAPKVDETKLSGLAKASPVFKKIIDAVKPKDKDAEAKAIAKNVVTPKKDKKETTSDE